MSSTCRASLTEPSRGPSFLHCTAEKTTAMMVCDKLLGASPVQSAFTLRFSPAIVILPQCHADHTPGWQQRGGEAALAGVDNALIEFHGNSNRVYLTGLSAGGNGVWYLASHNPDRFAPLLIVSAFVISFRDVYSAVAAKIAKVPIWIFHNDGDPNVPVEESRACSPRLRPWPRTSSTASYMLFSTTREPQNMHAQTCGHGYCSKRGNDGVTCSHRQSGPNTNSGTAAIFSWQRG